MANLSLRHLYKVYTQGGVKAVSDFNMEIGDNEFIVFVGPSGCGKSTTLRMIAGLEDITAGELLIDGKIVNHVQPKDRDIAMVFQNYALYPHMSTFDNMAFGLKIKKMPDEEIKKRVNAAAEILDIKDLLDRKPKNMSGGQRQRVALGRAIVRNPKVFLLDEPLSNLDAKLRTQMRIEIVKLHERLATTFVYVTHDQVEAMTMGSRIVVMKDGFVQQIDTPQNLYKYPLNKFVAGFIGTPQMNFYSGTLEKKGDNIIFIFANNQQIEYSAALFEKIMPEYLIGKKEVILGIRPEDIFIDGSRDERYPKAVLSCKVSVVEKLGSEVLLYGDMNFETTDIVSQSLSGITIKTDNKTEIEKDAIMSFVIDPEHIRLFDVETEKAIIARVPKTNYERNVVARKDTLKLFNHTFVLPSALQGKIPDGNYTAQVPTDAFIFTDKGASMGEYTIEDVSGVKLVRFTTENGCAFAIAKNEDIPKYFDIDMAKISLLDSEGKTVIASQTKQNFIKGSFVKDKKGIKSLIGVKNQTYSFILEGEQISCPDTMSARLAYAFGRMAFSKEMGFVFQPSDISLKEIPDSLVLQVEITELLDYGWEKLAVMKYKNTTLHANIIDESIGKTNIYIPWTKLSVYDLATKIRII